MLSMVVLPEPDGPRTATNSLSRKDIEMSSRATCEKLAVVYDLRISMSWSMMRLSGSGCLHMVNRLEPDLLFGNPHCFVATAAPKDRHWVRVANSSRAGVHPKPNSLVAKLLMAVCGKTTQICRSFVTKVQLRMIERAAGGCLRPCVNGLASRGNKMGVLPLGSRGNGI